MSRTMEQVLGAMSCELSKDVPDMARNVTAESLSMESLAFRVAVWRLQKEGYIAGVRFVTDGNSDYPRCVLVGGAFLTEKGQRGSDGVDGPVVYQGPVTFHNITVTGGSIGIVNSGNVGNIDAAIDALTREAQHDVADALRSLTESVLADVSLASKGREEVIEYLSYLSSQLKMPRETRDKSLPKMSLEAISKVVSVASGLAALWDRVYPVLKTALGV